MKLGKNTKKVLIYMGRWEERNGRVQGWPLSPIQWEEQAVKVLVNRGWATRDWYHAWLTDKGRAVFQELESSEAEVHDPTPCQEDYREEAEQQREEDFERRWRKWEA